MRKTSLLTFALLSAPLLSAAPVYTITNLGTLPGHAYSYARALNENGVVVGISDNTPFVWSAGAMSAVPGITYGGAYSVNDMGHIVGLNFDTSRGFYYNTVSSVTVGPGVQSHAYAINNNNEIVGNSSVGAWHSVAGATASIPADFGIFPNNTEALAINNSGQIAGGAYMPTGPKHPVLWNSVGGVPQDLGLFQPGGSAAAWGDEQSGPGGWCLASAR